MDSKTKQTDNIEETDINLDEELKDTDNKNSGQGLSVLIVDDDNFLLEMYARKFKNCGFEIMTASGGEDALTQIKAGSEPSIFLFDLIMPQMDGLELLDIIKKENLIPKTTKIVLSNQGQQNDIDKAEKIGVDGYIVKALHTPSEVVDIVAKTHKEKKQ